MAKLKSIKIRAGRRWVGVKFKKKLFGFLFAKTKPNPNSSYKPEYDYLNIIKNYYMRIVLITLLYFC